MFWNSRPSGKGKQRCPLKTFQVRQVHNTLWQVGDVLQQRKAIMGVFDEGCMGMYNAIVPDELLHPTGVFKERLSQSALYAAILCASSTMTG